MTTAAIIAGAGRGERFGGLLPKQYALLGGMPIFFHTIKRFLSCEKIDYILPVIHELDKKYFEEVCQFLSLQGLSYKEKKKPRLLPAVLGGDSRQDSVLCGLEALEFLPVDYVLIHDAARPCFSRVLIEQILSAFGERVDVDGVLVGFPVSDTLKRVWIEGDDILVSRTEDRSSLWRIQTPQAFIFPKILHAHKRHRKKGLTDDAAVAEAEGLRLMIIKGSQENIKVTEKEDLIITESILASQQQKEYPWNTSCGSGFDVHRFCAGKGLKLCGIYIPCNMALSGHSDADVALHSLADALYGASGGGDIGLHFPPSDARWKGVDSSLFLSHALDFLSGKGGELLHVDITIICQKPHISDYRELMRENLAILCRLIPEQVNIKATTTEGLGFTGRGEGIAVSSLVTCRYR